MNTNKLYIIGQRAIVILLVVCLGLFALNQFFAWHYKTQFLTSPCILCAELNPDVKNCIEHPAIATTNSINPIYLINLSEDEDYSNRR